MVTIAGIGIDERGIGESSARDGISRHVEEHILGLSEEAMAAQNSNQNSINVLIRTTPGVPLHVLEETQ